MDSVLAKRLNMLNYQNDILKQAEGEYRLLEAEEKSLEARLMLEAEGTSIAEKKMKALNHEAYRALQKSLAELKTKFNFEQRRFDILDKAYYAEYAASKRESELIDKHQVIT